VKDQTDAQLLSAYVQRRSEPAFAELVRRHVDFVFSAAQRMVCDEHLAEDVTQGVFLALAKSAGELKDRAVLSGWLHRTAQNIAAQTVRTDVRRRKREQEAAAMNELFSSESDPPWERIAPQLDTALGELSEPDRDALLLRYFGRKSAQEMAHILGISDEAAQKRVNRAVERLRDNFSKRNLTIGAGGLVILISANAVQAAPAGLAAAISTAALAGTTVATSTVITVAKTAAITAFQKTLIGATLTAVIGAGIYQTHQAAQLRNQIQTLQQNQTSLDQQMQQLQGRRDDATNRLAALELENEQLKSNQNTIELLNLRGEVARLETGSAQRKNDPTRSTATAWLNRVKQLKQYLEQHPEENIPELQYVSEQGWLGAVDPSMEVKTFKTPDDYCRQAVMLLDWGAEGTFGGFIQNGLQKYANANNGQFPTGLSQLGPYCEPDVEDILQQLYVIKPASILPASVVKDLKIETDWVVTRRKRVVSNSTSRNAYFASGCASWQSPPGTDDA
jgi:RNA polymerase sigma factor (sigma-70 family)